VTYDDPSDPDNQTPNRSGDLAVRIRSTPSPDVAQPLASKVSVDDASHVIISIAPL